MRIPITISIVSALFCLVGVSPCGAAPATTENTQALAIEDHLSLVLDANRHLPNVSRVAFYEKRSYKPEDVVGSMDTFKAQKEAIEAVKSRKLVNLIPALIPYLDYPAEGGIRDTPPIGSALSGEALRLWPAFNAIYSFGPQAVSPLLTAIGNSSIDIRLRLTALQVLYAIDKTQAEAEGQRLVQSATENKQYPLAGLVNSIINDQKPFWGIVDYQPINMSVEQVTELLSVDKHLANTAKALRWPKFPLPGASQSERDAARAESEIYQQQKEAMRNAGEIKLIALVPALIHYMDYPSDGGAYIVSSGSYSLDNRRRNWPALDAILKIGPDAVAPLQKFVADKTQTFKLRRTALSVLRDLAPDVAVASGQGLLEEAKQRGDEESRNAIEFILKRGENTSLLTILRSGTSKTK